MDIIKKGSELKKGDIIRNRGLILNVELEGDPKGFWCGKPNYAFVDINDAYYGGCTGELKVDEEFDILENRKEIVDFFKKIDSEMAKYIADMMELRKEIKELKSEVLRRFV